MLTFFPRFQEYKQKLERDTNRTIEQGYVLQTVTVLIDYLRRDYAATLAQVANLTAHGEITFDTLFAILIPRTIVVADCPITNEPRAFQLVSANPSATYRAIEIVCESIDTIDDASPSSSGYGVGAFKPAAPPTLYYASPSSTMEPADAGIRSASGKIYGRVQHKMYLPYFKGTAAISSLDVYPIAYHPKAAYLEKALIERGKKWVGLRGIHHMQYSGAASYTLGVRGQQKQTVRYNVSAKSTLLLKASAYVVDCRRSHLAS